VRAEQARFDEHATRAAHRVEDAVARVDAREVADGAGEQRVHAPRLEERAVRRFAVAVVADRLGGEPGEVSRVPE